MLEPCGLPTRIDLYSTAFSEGEMLTLYAFDTLTFNLFDCRDGSQLLSDTVHKVSESSDSTRCSKMYTRVSSVIKPLSTRLLASSFLLPALKLSLMSYSAPGKL